MRVKKTAAELLGDADKVTGSFWLGDKPTATYYYMLERTARGLELRGAENAPRTRTGGYVCFFQRMVSRYVEPDTVINVYVEEETA